MTIERANEIFKTKFPNGCIEILTESKRGCTYNVSTNGSDNSICRASSLIELLRQFNFNVIPKSTQIKYNTVIEKFKRDLNKGTFIDEWGDWGEKGKEVKLNDSMIKERMDIINEYESVLNNGICE